MFKASLYACPACGYNVKLGENFCQSCGAALKKKPLDEPINYYKPVNNYKGQIQLIGIVEIILGIPALLGGLLISLVSSIVPFLILQYAPEYGDMAGFAGFVVLAVGLLLFLFGLAQVVSGIKLLQHKNSGRIGTMIIGALKLFSFPIGTIFGLFALYVLTRPEVEELFSNKSRNTVVYRSYHPTSG
ncbi:MAG: hypothetical protein ACFFD4_08355 [Candidatus Odinarchaeota archaeon]